MPLHKRIIPLLFISAALLLTACSSKVDTPCTEEKNIPFAGRDTITLSPLAKGLFNYIKNNYAQMEFGTWQGREVLTLITRNSIETYFTQQFDSLGSINKINLEKEDFCFKTKNGYGIYNTRKGKMYLLQSIFENPVKITDSISTTLNLDLKKQYIMDQQAVLYADTDSVKSFLINYGINEQKNINYLDKNIFLIPNNGQMLTIGEYPRGYTKKYRQVRDAYYAMDSSANIYYTLAYSDSIYKMNLAGQYLNAAPVVKCSHFNNYEESDKNDLAYKRKYLATSEQNRALKIIDNKYIVILHRKKRENFNDKPVHQISVFDLNLNRVFLEELKADITPGIFHTSNKLFFLTMDFSVIYEYKFH